MKKIFLFLAIICSISVSAQRVYRIEGVPQRFVNALGIPINVASYYNNTSDSGIIFFDRNDTSTISFKYKGLVKKLAASRVPWDSITGKPVNFSTTYALSNDVRDSILARLRIIDTAGMLGGYTRLQRFLDSTLTLRILINTKQNVLTNPVTGTGTTNTLPKFTGTSTIGNSNITDNGSLITLNSNAVVNNNFGAGVTPSAWGNLTRAIQVGGTGSALWSFTSGATNAEFTYISNNTFNDNTNNTRIRDGQAAIYRQLGAEHSWFTAPTGTAGTNVSFTQRMTLDSVGNLGVGANFPIARVDARTSTGNGVQTTVINLNNANSGLFTGTAIDFSYAASNIVNARIGGQSVVGGGGALTFGVAASDGAAPTEYMRIAKDGTALIGTTSTDGISKLIVNGIVSSVFRSNSNYMVNGSVGGWDRRYGAFGSSGTDVGGFGFRGDADALLYYYIGNTNTDNIVRFTQLTKQTDFYGSIVGTTTTASTSPTTGALRTAGGLGVSGAGNFGGNLGVGVTSSPITWNSSYRAIQIGAGGSLYSNTGIGSDIYLASNAYFNFGGTLKYLNNGFASDYYQFNGGHFWRTAPSGTAEGNISYTTAMSLSNAGLLTVSGGGIFGSGITAQRVRATSLVLNKDSMPITTTNFWVPTVDTSGTPGTNTVNRRNFSAVHTGPIAFDTASRTLTINQISGGTTSVVIPRGTASGTSGITALSASRTGNLVTVSGDNGSSTIVSIRDADSASIMRFSDTAAMLAPFVQYSDTAAMLQPFIQYSDTTGLLDKSVRTFGNQNVEGNKTFQPTASSSVFYGNSVTVGQMADVTANRYSTQLATLLKTTEINRGISGTYMQFRTAGDSSMLERARTIPTYNSSYKYLFFSYGVNDSRNFAECDTASFREDYYIVLDSAIAKGWPLSRIKLLTPTYWNDIPAYQYRNLDYVNVTKSIGAVRGVQVIDTYTSFVQFGTGALMDADSIHPNTAGHTFIAKTIFGELGESNDIDYVQTFNVPAHFNSIVKANNLPIKSGSDTLVYVSNGVLKKSNSTLDFLPITGGNMRGPIDMDNHSIIDINQLISDTSLTNKNITVGFDYANLLTNGTTNRTAQLIQNLGGSFTLGLEGSAGSQLASGTGAYDAVLGTDNNYNLQFITNGLSRGRFTHWGRFVSDKSISTDSILARGTAGLGLYTSAGTLAASYGASGSTDFNFSSKVTAGGQITGAGYRFAYAAKSSNYTLTDNDDYINVTSSCTITLPTAVGRSGKRYVIKCVGSAIATIASTSSQTIDGNAASSYSFGGPNFNIMIVYSDGANWRIEAWATGI